MRAGAALLAGATLLGVSGCADRSADAAADVAADIAAAGSVAPPAFHVDTAVLGAISLDSLYVLGRATYDAQGPEAARAIWEFGLERARRGEVRDAANEALLLTWLGLVAYDLGDYERAERLEHEALAVEHAHGLLEHLPVTYNALVLIAWQRGRLAEATRWSDSTFAAARAVGDASYHAKALVNLGNLETALGELEAARDHMRQGLAALRELGDAANEARTLVNLAALERDAGNPDMALDYARRALELARDAGDTHGEEAALGQLASLYLLLGRHEVALATVDSALARAGAAGLRPQQAANLEILAGLHRQLGHLPRALRLYDSARAINLGLEERAYETGLDLYHMAEIQAALGNLDAARMRAEQARTLHAASGWATSELSDLLLLAEIEALAGEPDRANEHVAAARQVATDLGLRTSRLDVALSEARIADRAGDDERVLAVLGAVEGDLPVAGFAAESEAAALRARALARRGELAAAEAAGRRAIALIGRARGQLASGVFRSTLAHSRAGAYADLVDILLRRDRTDEAYEVVLAAGTGIRGRGPPPSPDGDAAFGVEAERRAGAEHHEELLRRIGRLAAEIRSMELDSWDPDLAAEPVERLREAHREYERLLAGAPADASVRRIRAGLRPGEVLLHYLVGDEQAFAFVVTREGTWATRLASSPAALATRVRLARRLLAGPASGAGGDPAEVLEALHTELIGSADGAGRLDGAGFLDGARRLIVVPHGVLTYLPFAALRNPATGRWLAEETELGHLPDATMLASGERGRRGAPGGSAREPPVRGAVFAPLPARLPATRGEARAVAAALAGGASLATGERATEAAVRAALAGEGIVHIASHAEMNAVNPLYSEIRLASATAVDETRPGRQAGPPRDPANDGRLEVHELFELSIGSPLVFLSGCETGLGAGWSSSYAAGEDFATLERGLLEAGTGNVVATLWRIEDESAAVFASRFYEELAGADPATALAGAQRAMIADARYAHPFHWAAYRVAGAGWHD